MEFSKLEKVELGGIKGKMLSHQVVEIFSEFNDIFAVFGNRTYDGLDATNRVCNIKTCMHGPILNYPFLKLLPTILHTIEFRSSSAMTH